MSNTSGRARRSTIRIICEVAMIMAISCFVGVSLYQLYLDRFPRRILQVEAIDHEAEEIRGVLYHQVPDRNPATDEPPGAHPLSFDADYSTSNSLTKHLLSRVEAGEVVVVFKGPRDGYGKDTIAYTGAAENLIIAITLFGWAIALWHAARQFRRRSAQQQS